MRICRWLARAAGGLALLACAAAQPSTVIKVDVNLVHTVATVKNSAGQLVGDLNKDDFEVFDNGARQQIAVFEHHTEMPLSVVLEIDTSGSTAKDLKYETDAASRFARALLGEGNPLDALSLWTFNWQVTQETRFTRNLKALEGRLKGLYGDAGTALYDALVFASRDLERREGRKAIIVVTDGGNTVSHYSIDDALQAAHMADVLIYSVVVVPITNEAGRNIGGEHALEILAQRTGGRIFFPAAGPDLDKVFADIIRELRTQYLIGFYPKNVPLTGDRFHRLVIRTKRSDLQVSARNGYYGAVERGGETGSPDQRISVTPDRPAPPENTPVKKKRD